MFWKHRTNLKINKLHAEIGIIAKNKTCTYSLWQESGSITSAVLYTILLLTQMLSSAYGLVKNNSSEFYISWSAKVFPLIIHPRRCNKAHLKKKKSCFSWNSYKRIQIFDIYVQTCFNMLLGVSFSTQYIVSISSIYILLKYVAMSVSVT